MTPIELIINQEPVSVNKLYFQPKGSKHRILTPEGRNFKAVATQSTIQQLKYVTNLVDISYKKLKLELYYYSEWFNKDKSIKKKDIANYEKAVVDCLFDAFKLLGHPIDDAQVFEMCLFKKQKVDNECVVIKIYDLP